jgi:hypothetical protein
MKTLYARACLRLPLVLMVLFVCQTAWAGLGLTFTPSATSNTYIGPVTLVVTGLSPGGSVVVQNYFDVNTDGIIDAGDLLVQQFTLTDSSNMVIGGVTNINVPGDTDSVPGQITAKLINLGDVSQFLVGTYLYKVSGSAGSITNSFMVTNSSYGQKFTGTVLNSGVPVPYAGVLLGQPQLGGGGNNVIGGTTANASGVYSIFAAPGTYALIPFASNYISDTAAFSGLVLAGGINVNTNLSLTPAAFSISGRAHDTNDSSIGLPGMLLPVQTSSGLLALAFTDTDGNFNVGVTADKWEFQGGESSITFHGYVRTQNKVSVTITSSSVSGVQLAMPKATALFYGTVKDSSGNPFPEIVEIYSSDNNLNITNGNDSVYSGEGYSDSSGYYVAGTVGSSDTNDFWQVQVDNASSFPNYNFSQPAFDFGQNGPGGTNMAVGKAVLANFTAVIATNQISGNVQFDGSPVPNVQLNGNTQDTNGYQAQAITDASGNYSMNVGNGNWYVNVNCQGNDNSLDSALGAGNYQCPCGVSVLISNNSATTNFTVLGGGSGEIYGYVTSTTAVAIANVNVYAQDCTGENYSTSTADDGSYTLDISNGVWDVDVDCGDLNSLGYYCVPDTKVTVSSDNVQVNFTAQSSSGPLQITTVSLPTGTVGLAYSAQLEETGGQQPYQCWSLENGSANLPPGLSLDCNGLLSGKPTTNGSFAFIVQIMDANSTTATQPLGIFISPKPSLSLAHWHANQFQLSLAGSSNQLYTLQLSTNLNSTNWISLLSTSNSTSNSFIVTDPNATNKQGFYRILINP